MHGILSNIESDRIGLAIAQATSSSTARHWYRRIEPHQANPKPCVHRMWRIAEVLRPRRRRPSVRNRPESFPHPMAWAANPLGVPCRLLRRKSALLCHPCSFLVAERGLRSGLEPIERRASLVHKSFVTDLRVRAEHLKTRSCWFPVWIDSGCFAIAFTRRQITAQMP